MGNSLFSLFLVVGSESWEKEGERKHKFLHKLGSSLCLLLSVPVVPNNAFVIYSSFISNHR